MDCFFYKKISQIQTTTPTIPTTIPPGVNRASPTEAEGNGTGTGFGTTRLFVSKAAKSLASRWESGGFYMDVSTKIVGKLPPNHPFLTGVRFPFFSPSILGENPLFLETPIWEGETKHTVDGNQKSGKLTSWGTGSWNPIIDKAFLEYSYRNP